MIPDTDSGFYAFTLSTVRMSDIFVFVTFYFQFAMQFHFRFIG